MNTTSKYVLKRPVLWLGLIFIVLLIALSVCGAFLGPDRAKAFFNSIPLSLYWLLFALVLIAGLLLFPRLVRVPSLLLIHAGCLLILAGALWGSQKGLNLQTKLFGTQKLTEGIMGIYEGDAENTVHPQSEGRFIELPFSIRLKDFRVEYYKPAHLYIRSRERKTWKLPVEVGTDFTLDAQNGKVRILRTFQNFKITIADGNTAAIDSPQPGRNPALEVEFEDPNGAKTVSYVFERFPGHTHETEKFELLYSMTKADYLSDIEVVKDGKVVSQKTIEVNKPLHYGGYHFYQSDYDQDNHEYTILSVTSDSGLYCVYTGYCFLCVGAFWCLWFERLSTGVHPKN